MRILLLIIVLALTACSSRPDVSGVNGEIDEVAAAKTRISLGLSYLKIGNYQQAKFNLDKAIEFAPRLADAHYSLAYYYQIVGELKDAEDAYQTALDYAPQNADIANTYGAFLCQQGQYAKAKKFFLKAINNRTYTSTAQSYQNLAVCAQENKQEEDAIEYLKKGLQHQPGHAASLFSLAQLYVKKERWAEAKDALARFQKYGRVSADMLDLAVLTEHGLGNKEIAMGYGDMLVRMYPGHPKTRAFLARTKSKVTDRHIDKKVKAERLAAQAQSESVKADSTKNKVEKAADKVVKVAAEAKPAVSQKGEIPAFHIVQRNENLYRISLLYNLRMQRLIEWNGLKDASSIFAGMKLLLADPNK